MSSRGQLSLSIMLISGCSGGLFFFVEEPVANVVLLFNLSEKDSRRKETIKCLFDRIIVSSIFVMITV